MTETSPVMRGSPEISSTRQIKRGAGVQIRKQPNGAKQHLDRCVS